MSISLRPILAPLVGAVVCLAAAPYPDTARRSPILERFVAQAVSVSGSEKAGRIDIYIERWSTDEDLNRLRGPLMEDAPGRLLPVLQQLKRRAGVVLMPGIQAHGARVRTRTPRNLLFAREIVTTNGRRVVAASIERLGLGETPLKTREQVQEFNLIDIRFGPDGTGVGKVAEATDVVLSPETKMPDVKSYVAQPVRLIDVRSEKS